MSVPISVYPKNHWKSVLYISKLAINAVELVSINVINDPNPNIVPNENTHNIVPNVNTLIYPNGDALILSHHIISIPVITHIRNTIATITNTIVQNEFNPPVVICVGTVSVVLPPYLIKICNGIPPNTNTMAIILKINFIVLVIEICSYDTF